MKFSRRNFVAAIFALATAFTAAAPSFAQNAGYTPITPAQPTEDASKIEVLEFFSYGCPHCGEFYPALTAWVGKQSPDVVVHKVPVSFNGYFQMLAPLYYTLEVMGEVERLDKVVFKTIHIDGNRLADARARSEWATKNGLDAKKFDEIYNSFAVSSKVRRAAQLTQAYKVQGVPALAVEGKYLIGGKDFAETLMITDILIAKSRSEKSGKK